MRIKTITCHEVYNYGAVLQEYALIEYLRKLGHEASTINYRPEYLGGKFDLWKVTNPKYERYLFMRIAYVLLKLPGRIIELRRKRAFDRFSNEYLVIDDKVYRSNEELKVSKHDAEAYICGSDQIWNTFFQNGKDPAFYLDFVPDNLLKISYAASFAIDEIEEEYRAIIRERIARLKHIGVRESSGVRIVENLGIAGAVQVMDPVFLLAREHWEGFIIPIKEKYLLVYDTDFNNRTIEKLAKKLAYERGLKLFSISKSVKYADNNYWLKGPEFFISLIAQAEFVVANSFHALAFSLIFEREFIIVKRHEEINTRMRDLLERLKLPSCLVDNEMEDEYIPTPIPYERIRRELLKDIQRSKEFLKEALN